MAITALIVAIVSLFYSVVVIPSLVAAILVGLFKTIFWVLIVAVIVVIVIKMFRRNVNEIK